VSIRDDERDRNPTANRAWTPRAVAYCRRGSSSHPRVSACHLSRYRSIGAAVQATVIGGRRVGWAAPQAVGAVRASRLPGRQSTTGVRDEHDGTCRSALPGGCWSEVGLGLEGVWVAATLNVDLGRQLVELSVGTTESTAATRLSRRWQWVPFRLVEDRTADHVPAASDGGANGRPEQPGPCSVLRAWIGAIGLTPIGVPLLGRAALLARPDTALRPPPRPPLRRPLPTARSEGPAVPSA
jgi:hypothetical protein